MKAEEFIKSFLIVDKNDLSNTGVPFIVTPNIRYMRLLRWLEMK